MGVIRITTSKEHVMYRSSILCLFVLLGNLQYAQDSNDTQHSGNYHFISCYKANNPEHRENIKAYGLMSDKYMDDTGAIHQCCLGEGNVIPFQCVPCQETDEYTFGYPVDIEGRNVRKTSLRLRGNWHSYHTNTIPLVKYANFIRYLENAGQHSNCNDAEILVLRQVLPPSELEFPEELLDDKNDNTQ